MPAVVYRNDFFSESGTQWRIDIYDNESSASSPATFNTYGSGFVLTYQGTDNDVFSAIIPSEVKVNCAVEDQTFMDVIDDIISSSEKRFYIYIYKGGSFNYYWSGPILADLGQTTDESFPTEVQLTAVDGIGFLKDFTYGNPQVDYEGQFPIAYFDDKGYETMLKHLSRIFNGLFIIQGGTLHTTDIFSTAVNYYEDNMHSGTPATSLDPLDVTRMSHKAFIKWADSPNKFNEGLTYYEVLEQICLIFNARFFLADGKWRLYNVNQYTGTSFSERTYDLATSYPYEFTNPSTTALSINKTVNQSTVATIASMNRSYFPDFINITREFDRTNSRNIIPIQDNYKLSAQNQFNGFEMSNNLSLSSNIRLRLKGSGELIIYNSDEDQPMPDVTFSLQGLLYINDGNGNWKYNKNQRDKNNKTSWEDNGTATFITIEEFDIGPGTQYVPFTFDILTDDCPIKPENIFFSMDLGTWSDEDDNSFPLGGGIFNDVSVDYDFNNIELSFEFDGIPQPDPINTSYYSWNSSAADNSIYIEVPQSLIGDNKDSMAFGKLQVKDTSGDWVDSESWKINGSGTAYEIINLQITEIAKIRTTPTQKLNGSIKADMDFYDRLVYDGVGWVMLGGTLNAKEEIWEGQWFEIAEVSSTITLTNNTDKINQPPPISIPATLKNTLANVNKASNYNNNYKASTTNNTKTETYIDGVENKRLELRNNQVANFKAYAVGVITTGSNKGDVIALEQFGCIKNIDKTISLVGTTSETKNADSGISGSVSLSIEPDSTNQSIKVSVTGEASESVEWKIGLNLTKIGFQDVYSIIYEDGNNIINEDSNNLVSELNF
tara:strand:+ start:12041 stop:14539 length:2499 start_codon:yes stop_codon:yes gene_type:complete